MITRLFHLSVLFCTLLSLLGSGAVAPVAAAALPPAGPSYLTGGAGEETTTPLFAPHRVIVKFRAGTQPALPVPGLSRTHPAARLSEVGVKQMTPLFPAALPDSVGLARIHRLELEPEADVLAVVKALSADPAVEWAEPDYIARAADITPNDPHYPTQWGLTQIQAPAAWDVVTGTPTVVIAIVDSGIQQNHPDLDGHLWTNPGEIPANGVDDDNNGYVDDVHGWNFVVGTNDISDGNGHGTQVAGVAAAESDNGTGVAGVCWNCRLMPVKVMADSGLANYSDIAAGVRYAADKGAQVINLSLGGYAHSNALQDAVAYAVEHGAVVVGGAGNDNTSAPFYPAAYDDVLAVAGTAADDTKADFSDYGTWVDLAAPAVAITTTFLGGDYGPADGTSLAAPFVSGLAGLIRSRWPDWTPAMVRSQLVQTADDLDTLNPAYAGKLGAGRINAVAAMQDPHPVLTLAGTAVNDDPLGRPTPGEAATLAVTLSNDWLDATGVTGILTTTDPYVTLGQASSAYGDIPAGDTGTSGPLYTFTVASGAGYNHPIPFTLTVTANGGTYTTTLPFTITTRSGDEHFCGTVASDQTWTSDKTYILDCNVGIAPGYTLTIEAGTEVHFSGNYTLSVGGTLLADGTPAQPIRFMPHTEGGNWGRIFFDDPGADAQTTPDGDYLSGSLLRYVYIEGAAQGLGCNDATPYLAHVTLDGGGMDCAAGDTPLWIRDSDLRGDVQIAAGSGVDALLGTWAARSDMPTARHGLAAAVVDGKIYAIGGYTCDGGCRHLNTAEAYDPTTDSWRAVAPMPTARCELAAAVVGGKIYAIGGRGSGGTLNTVEEYDPATDSWRAVAPMPTARQDLAVAVVDGKIYAIGGYYYDGSSHYLNTVEEYDPATDSWRTVSPMPTARQYPAAAVVDGKLYAIGGWDGNYLNTVEEYDPTTDTWRAVAPMPTGRYGLAAAVVDGKIYALGGYGLGGDLNTVEEYDPATDRWRAVAPMPTARKYLAAAAINGRIYAIGGRGSSGYLNTVEAYDPPTLSYGYALLRSTVAGDLSLPDYAQVLTATLLGDVTVGARGRVQNNAIDGDIGAGNDATVQDNTIRGNVGAGSGATVKDNTVRNGGVSVGSGATVEGNDIEDAPDWGIQASGAATVRTNRLVGCGSGIRASGLIARNLVANTAGTGLELSGSATVEENTFTAIGGSAVKISSGTAVTITENNFEFNTGPYDVENRVAKATMPLVPAQYNWWGTTNTAAIRQRIYDFSDDYNLGQVLYAPVLTGPVQTAPAYVRAITLTPESPVGIQTVAFDLLFSREMDPDVEPQMAFRSTALPRWAARSAMPTARRGLAAAAINGKLYAIGGYGNSGYLNTVEEYDPATDSWRAVAPMPTARAYLAAAVVDGKLYVIGGYNNGYLNTVEEYDPATDSWRAVAPMPTARSGLAAAAVNGHIYAIGGYDGSDRLNTVEEYDPAADTWRAVATMPTARAYLAAAAVNGKIYAIGGSGGYSTVEEYDPATDRWRTVAPMPTARYGLAAAVVDGHIYAIGGYYGGHLNTVEEYDPATDTWRAVAPMPTAREYLAAAVASGKIYALGGEGSGGFLNTVEEMILPTLYTGFYGGSWPAPNRYRATYDFSTLIPRDAYTLTVSGAQVPQFTGSGTAILPVPCGGMAIPPNEATTFTVDYAGYINDTTAPPVPSVTACAAATPDTLSAHWSAHDPESSIDRYQYAIGLAPGGTEVVNWTYTTLTATTRVSLSLVAGQTYYVSVKARNEGGIWSETGSAGVVAGSDTCESNAPTLEVDFTATPRSGDAPLTVQFTSTVTGTVTAYEWRFGDGGTAATANPTHTYQNAGRYGVMLVVTGTGGTASVSKADYITVNAPPGAPTATFSADVTQGTAPLTVTFTAVTSGTVEHWRWDFGDGGQAYTGPVVTHTYTSPGVFDVGLTVSNTYGSYTANRPDYITVTEPAPQVDFTATPRSGDAPLTVQFTSTVTGTVTAYGWRFGDGGTAATANPTHTYQSAGSYGVTLVVTGTGGTASVSKADYITVNAPPGAPTATFSADVTQGTAPLTVTFTAVTGGTVEHWRWDFGDGGTMSGTGGTAFVGMVVSHTYITSGTFDVGLTVSNTYGSYTVGKPDYITVVSGGSEEYSIYLPLVVRDH